MSGRRAGWDETWIAVAFTVAKRSRCVRDQVGAVIVDSRNRIVSTGYNGPAANYPMVTNWGEDLSSVNRDCNWFCPRAKNGPSDETVFSYTDCPSLHAEANAIAVADRSTFEGGTLYVSSDVCQLCAKQISNSGLARVVVASARDRDYRDSDSGYELLRLCDIRVDHHARVP